MRISVVTIVLFISLTGVNGFSQQLTPPIQNHSPADYNAASQNWGVTVDDDGVLYAANNQGLLSFDGQRWELFSLASGSIIRSVFSINGRIYTGAYQEFGYWERNKTGKLEYTSLSSLLKGGSFKSEEFWEILFFNGAIYFRSFDAIYKYKDNTIELVKDVVSSKMFVYHGRLILALGEKGLFYLKDDNILEPLPNQEAVKGERVVDMGMHGKDLVLGTRKGLFRFDGKSIKSFGSKELKIALRKHEFNNFMSYSSDELVIGTVKNGIIHANTKTDFFNIYNRNDGLQNNTVLGMAEWNGTIWLALDKGIDEVVLNSAISFFTDDSGELGAVYDLAFFKGDLYLASNTGVYKMEGNNLKLVMGAVGHTWNLEVINDFLYANHNRGSFKIIDDAFVPIEDRTGSFQVTPGAGKQELRFFGTYTGITVFSEKENRFWNLEGIDFSVKQIIFENEFTIWAAHPYEGIYRIEVETDYKKSTGVTKMARKDTPGFFRSHIFSINNQIAIYDQGTWYRYNPFSESLEDLDELDEFNGHRLVGADKGEYWFIDTQENSIVFSGLKAKGVIIPEQYLQKRMVKENENIVKFNDSIYYVTLNDGFARINKKEFLKAQEEELKDKPLITGLIDSRKRHGLNSPNIIPYEDSKNITVFASYPVSKKATLNYELIGRGTDTIRGRILDGRVAFQNLKSGNYLLNLFAVSPRSAFSKTNSIEFNISSPWYLAGEMKVVYFLMGLLTIFTIYRINKEKLKRHRKILEGKFEKEHRERLERLEKERLINEIDLKRKELANTTAIAARKNEVLMEIQGELNKNGNKAPNQFRMKHIMNKLNKAIKDNDEWKVFETNFKELHEDFFRLLLESYPKLSSKDLKLCAYLKMNLTSKEIAPLMGITVRGVEVHRYRLRKKMDLKKEENLSNFLIKNF